MPPPLYYNNIFYYEFGIVIYRIIYRIIFGGKFMILKIIKVAKILVATIALAAVLGASQTKDKLPIFSVETPEKVVAITLNAAWGADDTDVIIKILDEYDAKATFFVCGYWVAKHPEAVKKFHNAGHVIANHGDTHAHVNSLSLNENIEEIAAAHTRVLGLLGVEMDLYRPPYGEFNSTVMEAARRLKYHVIQWDVDSLDWKRPTPDAMAARVLNHKNLGNGSIILFHCDIPETPIALRKILSELKNRGYRFVTVCELIHRENYKIDHKGRQFAL
jgi:peptidoglycan/xylan/chitin deacetylase (PgdA/CDA1 family)